MCGILLGRSKTISERRLKDKDALIITITMRQVRSTITGMVIAGLHLCRASTILTQVLQATATNIHLKELEEVMVSFHHIKSSSNSITAATELKAHPTTAAETANTLTTKEEATTSNTTAKS